MPTPTHTDRSTLAVSTSSAASSPHEPEGRLVRAKARPGLTGVGVAVLGTSVAVVASILSELITEGLGWMYSIPFILVSIYCALEVAPNSLRSAIVMPPLVTLLVSVISPIWANTSTPRGWISKTLITLTTTIAPTMVIATVAAAAIVGWRYWRSNR